MGLYRRCVFPWLLDATMSQRLLAEPRRRTLARATGRILEIGFGTGANLPHYPRHVSHLDALDPDSELDRYSRPRIAAATTIEVTFHRLGAERLPFDTARFDTIVCTFTLCSIPDVARALAEARRVLRPGGRFLYLEHGLAPDPRVARWQQRLNPVQKRVGGGCNLNRDPRALLRAAGFHESPDQIAQYYLPGVPRPLGFVTEGIALNPDHLVHGPPVGAAES